MTLFYIVFFALHKLIKTTTVMNTLVIGLTYESIYTHMHMRLTNPLSDIHDGDGRIRTTSTTCGKTCKCENDPHQRCSKLLQHMICSSPSTYTFKDTTSARPH